eukprot:PLAT1268.1.p2 GENE.PLAT1268.1~~PLAT1268.1.p2  ORF type:complete len:418 (+),score=208.96 PLAT1268.1:47-1300(+)
MLRSARSSVLRLTRTLRHRPVAALSGEAAAGAGGGAGAGAGASSYRVDLAFVGAGLLAGWYMSSKRESSFYWKTFDCAAWWARGSKEEDYESLLLTLLARDKAPIDSSPSPLLATTVAGVPFSNPVVMADGFDRVGMAAPGLSKLGVGGVEIGPVTVESQAVDAPRMLRLAEDASVIDQTGDGNWGVEPVVKVLSAARRDGSIRSAVGVALAGDSAEQFATLAAALTPVADYLVVNVDTSDAKATAAALAAVRLTSGKTRNRDGGLGVPVLLKVQPDVSDEDKRAIAALALDSGLDGIVIGASTESRPDTLRSPLASEAGRLRGAPAYTKSTETLRDLYTLTGGRVPLIAGGGVMNGRAAYAKLRAGASAVTVFSALVEKGFSAVPDMKSDLTFLMQRDGYTNVSQVVGADLRAMRE